MSLIKNETKIPEITSPIKSISQSIPEKCPTYKCIKNIFQAPILKTILKTFIENVQKT